MPTTVDLFSKRLNRWNWTLCWFEIFSELYRSMARNKPKSVPSIDWEGWGRQLTHCWSDYAPRQAAGMGQVIPLGGTGKGDEELPGQSSALQPAGLASRDCPESLHSASPLPGLCCKRRNCIWGDAPTSCYRFCLFLRALFSFVFLITSTFFCTEAF